MNRSRSSIIALLPVFMLTVVTSSTAQIRAAGEDGSRGQEACDTILAHAQVNWEFNAKYPGGLESQRMRLESEGHDVVAKGKKLFVPDYEASLARLEGD